MNFNKAIILGNLTNNPDTRMLPSGQPVTSFGVATNRIYTDKNGAKQQSAEFHNIVSFGRLADICSRYLLKGSLVLIEGRIQTRSWVDQSGVKKFKTEIIAETMQLGPKKQGDEPFSPRSVSPASTEEIPVIEVEESISSPQAAVSQEEGEIEVKDIPF